jgi:hypothetical protein
MVLPGVMKMDEKRNASERIDPMDIRDSRLETLRMDDMILAELDGYGRGPDG